MLVVLDTCHILFLQDIVHVTRFYIPYPVVIRILAGHKRITLETERLFDFYAYAYCMEHNTCSVSKKLSSNFLSWQVRHTKQNWKLMTFCQKG